MDLYRHVIRSARDHWAQAERYQRLLYRLGGLLLLSAAFHLVVLVVTGGSVEGETSWRKPILFGEAFGLTAITLGWVMTYLPKRQTVGWILATMLAVSTTYEVVWVSVQQWRGVPSHFNYSTPFDTAAFSAAGAMVGLTGLVVLSMTGWSFLSLSGPASLRVAIRGGLLLLLASQAFGFAIIENGNFKVFDQQTGDYLPERVAEAAIFGAAGEMKLPHALSVHAIQLLPALAGLLSLSGWSEQRRWRLVRVAGVAYAGLVAVSASQTFRGLAPFDLELLPALLFGASAAGLLGVYAVAALRIPRASPLRPAS